MNHITKTMKLATFLFFFIFISISFANALPVNYYGAVTINGANGSNVAIKIVSDLETFESTYNETYIANIAGTQNENTLFYIWDELVETQIQPIQASSRNINLSFIKINDDNVCVGGNNNACLHNNCLFNICKPNGWECYEDSQCSYKCDASNHECIPKPSSSGGSLTPKTWFTTIDLGDIIANEETDVNINKDDFFISKIEFVSLENKNGVKFNLDQYKPSSYENIVYAGAEINTVHVGSVENVVYYLKINNSWFETNSIGLENVSFDYLKDDAWESVKVDFISEDNSYKYFTVDINSIPEFVLFSGIENSAQVEIPQNKELETTEKLTTDKTTGDDSAKETPKENLSQVSTPTGAVTGGNQDSSNINPTWLYILLGLISIGLLIALNRTLIIFPTALRARLFHKRAIKHQRKGNKRKAKKNYAKSKTLRAKL